MENPMATNKGFGQIKRPKSLVCYICGREYGTKSLGIHIKNCLKKWDIEQSQKPKRERRAPPDPPRGLIELLEKDEISFDDIERYNGKAFDKYNEEALVMCEFCNRTFLPERMPGHRKTCTKEKPFKPLPPRASQLMNAGEQDDRISNAPSNAGRSNRPSGANMAGGRGAGGYNVDYGDAYGDGGDLNPCRICGRSFANDRLAKHEAICQKASAKNAKHEAKVKAKQRELEMKQQKGTKFEVKKKSNWRAQHEDFVQNLRYMRNMKQVQAAGGDIRSMPPPPSSKMSDDRVPCPHCGRKFAEETAMRHIPKCKDTINKPKPPPGMRSASTNKSTAQMSSKNYDVYNDDEHAYAFGGRNAAPAYGNSDRKLPSRAGAGGFEDNRSAKPQNSRPNLSGRAADYGSHMKQFESPSSNLSKLGNLALQGEGYGKSGLLGGVPLSQSNYMGSGQGQGQRQAGRAPPEPSSYSPQLKQGARASNQDAGVRRAPSTNPKPSKYQPQQPSGPSNREPAFGGEFSARGVGVRDMPASIAGQSYGRASGNNLQRGAGAGAGAERDYPRAAEREYPRADNYGGRQYDQESRVSGQSGSSLGMKTATKFKTIFDDSKSYRLNY
eukprot:TRINITY_DN5791_c0_g2_i3.p1 TRINITY_DN5791_c0_g2~~TRINITY_DN5791_c0_g2_i3.p1  ORF type:complete len:611 (+),score=103.21 TRINITY_DN5791_c0_g2_i3:105-1937(+)